MGASIATMDSDASSDVPDSPGGAPAIASEDLEAWAPAPESSVGTWGGWGLLFPRKDRPAIGPSPGRTTRLSNTTHFNRERRPNRRACRAWPRGRMRLGSSRRWRAGGGEKGHLRAGGFRRGTAVAFGWIGPCRDRIWIVVGIRLGARAWREIVRLQILIGLFFAYRENAVDDGGKRG